MSSSSFTTIFTAARSSPPGCQEIRQTQEELVENLSQHSSVCGRGHRQGSVVWLIGRRSRSSAASECVRVQTPQSSAASPCLPVGVHRWMPIHDGYTGCLLHPVPLSARLTTSEAAADRFFPILHPPEKPLIS